MWEEQLVDPPNEYKRKIEQQIRFDFCSFDSINNVYPLKDNSSWNMVGARIKIMWEEQLVDPPNEYITPVNVP